ncbi:DNA-processing protein DprA, partial [bacterium]|nr:DNA-processing protein DprA [candidate division CSSED10-310 bacterium]
MMNHDAFRKWLALSLWEDLGPRNLNRIRMSVPEPWQVLDDPSILDVVFAGARHPGKPPRDTLLHQADTLLNLARYGEFGILPIMDNRYPRMLAAIAAPPPVLYYRGDLLLLKHPCLAVVGTRDPSEYGRTVAQLFSDFLARQSFAIVSGLARGIDAIAHSAALDAGGTTIAVLGCGLDQLYPQRNIDLRRRIEAGGCAITEFPWNTPPNASHFPRRNRIISGLSLGILIVESTEKSGALNTVKHALDQDRDVFAIPGPITSPTSRGPIRVIQQGAIAV